MPRNPRIIVGGDDEEVDRQRTVEDWKRMPIVQLKEKARQYGLSNAGVKNMVVARLHSFFHTDEEAPQAAENAEPIPITLPTADTVTMNMADLRQILKEASQAKAGNQETEITGRLSPASATVAPDINAISNQFPVAATNSNPWPAQSLSNTDELVLQSNNNGGDRRPETPEERKEETKKEENEDEPDEKKFFHQGDMRMTQTQKEELEKAYKNGEQRDVISFSSAKWQHYTVPYVIDASIVKQTAKDAINGAIRDFHLYSCLWFVERVDEDHYIKFVKDTGCWSYVGMLPKHYLDQGYEQTISIGDGCEYKGTAIHEIMHALGFFHEHARIDRDNYVKVNYENMNADVKNNFVKETNQVSLGVAYDYNSIMHYPDWAFSNNGKPTLEATGDAVGAEIGQRDGLTAGDIDQLNIHYGCNDIVKRSMTMQRAAIATGKGKDRQGGKCAIRFQKQKEREAKRKERKEDKKLQKQDGKE